MLLISSYYTLKWAVLAKIDSSHAIGTCNISSVDLKRLESFQGTIIKNSVYLGKRCHHSALMEALDIPKIKYHISNKEQGSSGMWLLYSQNLLLSS